MSRYHRIDLQLIADGLLCRPILHCVHERHIVPCWDAVADLLELGGLADVLLEHLLDLVEAKLLATTVRYLLFLGYTTSHHAKSLLITDDICKMAMTWLLVEQLIQGGLVDRRHLLLIDGLIYICS